MKIMDEKKIKEFRIHRSVELNIKTSFGVMITLTYNLSNSSTHNSHW